MWFGRKWPKLMNEWENIEQTLPQYDEKKKNFKFFIEIKWYTGIITVSLFGKI